MTTLIMRHRLRPDSDEGIAMMSVLFFLLIATILGSTVIAVSLNAIPASRHEANYHAALAAAEAGVDDYIDRLDEDYNYATDPSDGNLAFTQCVPIVTNSAGCYQYKVDTSKLQSTGTILLTSTGRVGTTQRTVKIGLRPFGFLDALDMDNYNLVDPSIQLPGWLVGGSQAATTQDCVWHAWETRTGPDAGGTGPDLNQQGCQNLVNYWITGNEFDGPLQSNDDYYLCGTPKFDDDVFGSSSSTAPYWRDPFNGCGGDNPSFANGSIESQPPVVFPPKSNTILNYVRPGVAGDGCLYTGPTSIKLNGNSMTVVSPNTKSTNPNCVGTGVPLPANGTIYVQDSPASTTDPNYGVCSPMPISNYTGDLCKYGDAFVQGNLTGQLTIAASNNVFITGSLTYGDFNATAPRPVLGLIATNSVEVFHPTTTTCTNGQTDSPFYSGWCNLVGNVNFDSAGSVKFAVPVQNPEIDAAILSLQHSFAVQNFYEGSTQLLGDINLHGVVAGNFMDIEGVFTTGGTQYSGYGVNYKYDTRFRDGGLVPPNFLDPTATFWHRVSYADCGSSTTNC